MVREQGDVRDHATQPEQITKDVEGFQRVTTRQTTRTPVGRNNG